MISFVSKPCWSIGCLSEANKRLIGKRTVILKSGFACLKETPICIIRNVKGSFLLAPFFHGSGVRLCVVAGTGRGSNSITIRGEGWK